MTSDQDAPRPPGIEAPFRIGGRRAVPATGEIEGPDGAVRLEPRSMAVLTALADAAGEVLSRADLIDRVWGDAYVTEEVLTHCVWELRRALGDDARQPSFIQTVPRRGYRIVAEVEREAPRPASLAGVGTARPPSVAVLPFIDLSPTQDRHYLADGLTDELIHALSRVAGIRVVSRTSVYRFRNHDQDPREIGPALGAGLLLEGSLRSAGERLRVLARLVSADDGLDLWAETFDRMVSDLFDVLEEIAQAIARRLELGLETKRGRGRPSAAPGAEAQRLYLQGRHFQARRTADDLDRAVAAFEGSLALAPEYPRALAALADARLLQSVYGLLAPADALPEAQTAAERCLRADPESAEAHASLGVLHVLRDAAWEASESSFRRALELDPSYPTARQWLAIFCLVPTGRDEEARRQLERAVELDPLSPAVFITVAFHRYYTRRFDEAIQVLDGTLKLDRHFATAHQLLGLTLAELGREDEAFASLATARELAPESAEVASALGWLRGRAGREVEARRILRELAQRSDAGEWVSPIHLAQVHLALGDRPAALGQLEAAAEVGAPELPWIGVRATFDPLRDESRFQALLQALRLPGGI